MTNPLLKAFFLGRTTADVLYEELENTFTDVLSELGKFDAEQREKLRQFTSQVIERAEREAELSVQGRTSSTLVRTDSQPTDLQATIDQLRAEIAHLRSELQNYRSRSV